MSLPGSSSGLDRFTRLAAAALDAPVALLALARDARAEVVSIHGLDMEPGEVRTRLVEDAARSRDALILPDARSDVRFAADPMIVEQRLVAWLAVPVRGPGGGVLGRLAVASRSPREWAEEDVRLLEDAATAVATAVALEDPGSEWTRFRDVVEDIEAIVWEFDMDAWRFTFVSRRAEAILGYPVERWTEESGFWEDQVLHPEDRDWAVAYCHEATESGRDHEFDYRAVAEDGRVVWLKDRVRVVPPEEGRPRLLRGVMVEITADRSGAEALRRSEEKFRQIAENVREIFWIFDPSFTETIYVSPAYEVLWGRPVETVYENPATFVEAVHPEDVARLRDAMENVARSPVDGVEYRIVHPDGTIRWAFSRGYPVFDDEGRVYRVVGTTEDVTDRKLAQDRLAAAEAHYRLLVENAPYAIYALDANGRFVELNAAGEALLEREPGSVLGEHFSSIIAPESIEAATSAFERVMAGEADHIEFDEWVIQSSGGKRLVRVTESAMRENGAIIGTHGVGRDITGEFEKDRQLRRAERLASIGTLIGGVAHELNNPLQSISSFTSLLLENARSGEEMEDLQTIQREALRASQIVSNLRLLARQAQDGPAARAPLDINDVVRHVLKTRRYPMETGNIELVEELGQDLPPVLGDRGQLEQVVLNLVVNAEHAMDGVDRKRLEIRTRASQEGVIFEIADSGVGIAPDHLEHVFDPFFTTKGPGEGTGLGLSLVYGIISEHGGAVNVDSERGAGTVMRIQLPRAGVEEAARPVPRPQVPTRPLRILVVDDEPAIRGALGRYLARRRGHTVDEAGDGEEALEMLARRGAEYDVILSDLRMPGLGGDQLLVRLGALGTGLERRVVFLTGDAASGHAARVLAAADAPVLFKPIELSEVADYVERHAAGLRGDAGGA